MRRDILFEGQVSTDSEGTWVSDAFETTGIFRVQVAAGVLGMASDNPALPFYRGITVYESCGDENGDPLGIVCYHPLELQSPQTPGTVASNDSYVFHEFVPSARFFYVQAHDLYYTSMSRVEQFCISIRAISDSTTDGLD